MKRALIFLGLGAVALSLASCNSTNGTTSTSVESTTNATTTNTTSTEDNYNLKISTPNGAPLIAISGAVEKSDIENEYLKIIADTDALPAIFQAGTEDVIVAPVNAGTKLYNLGNSKYKLASVITWGNTYFTSGKDNFKLEDMNNQEVTLFGKISINAGIAKYVLAKKNITPTYVYPETDVVASIKTVLEDDPTKMVMIAEPVLTVTATSIKKSQSVDLASYSIANLYKEITNHDYPQAAIFINPDAYTEHKNKFDEFLSAVETTCANANDETKVSEVATKANSLGVPQPAAVLTKAIPGCSIKYVKASSAKADLEFAATEEGLKIFFGEKAPDNAFYLI